MTRRIGLFWFVLLLTLCPIHGFRIFRSLWSSSAKAFSNTPQSKPFNHPNGTSPSESNGKHVTQADFQEVMIASQAENVSLEQLKDRYKQFSPETLEFIFNQQALLRQLRPPEMETLEPANNSQGFNNASTYFSLIHSLKNAQNTKLEEEEIPPFEVLMQNHKTMAYLKFDPTGNDLLKCQLFDSEKDPMGSEMIAKLIRRRPPMVANQQQMMDAIRHCTEHARLTLIRNGFLPPPNETMPIERISRNPNEQRYNVNASQPLIMQMAPGNKTSSIPGALPASQSAGQPAAPAPNNQLSGDIASHLLSVWKGILPGTKWCGLGDAASNYDDLGDKADIDICCRAHDHCPIRLKAWHLGWNTLNFSFYTKSHCECDEDFYRCLKKSPNSYASTLGQFYFNILKVQCLRPKLTCLKARSSGEDCDDYKIDYFGRNFK